MGRPPLDQSTVARWGKKKEGRLVIPDARTTIALALACSADTPGAVDPGWLLCGDGSIAPPPPTWELVTRLIRDRASAPVRGRGDRDREYGERLTDHELAELATLMQIEPDSLDAPPAGRRRPDRGRGHRPPTRR